MLAAILALSAAWHPPRVISPLAAGGASARSAAAFARVKNSDSDAAEAFQPRKLGQKALSKLVAEKAIGEDGPDLRSPVETFDELCRMCGMPPDRGASIDFDSFVLAFEQLYTRGVSLEPEYLSELHAAVGAGDEVSASNWEAFHQKWLQASTMEALLAAEVEKKRTAASVAAAAAKREQEWEQRLVKAQQEAAQKALSSPRLLADEAAKKKKARGKWFEERESAALAAAQYRSLDPERWIDVTEGIGGLREALEEIRRRIWTPLCAPRQLLDELGTERVKGLLLYGPPGCGKSYLAARLSAGLSRRPPTVVSGPEIMDKYVGSSEAQLRTIFTSPPRVPARPGDAEDVMMIAEDNELHVIVLDEFDAIARKRSDGSTGDTSMRDSVVNQLLVLMDGVAQLPVPTFVLALTNRRELIDEAVLRPGRLEVHVEVNKPDMDGRVAILRIHAEKMRESGRLALDDGAIHTADECTLDRVDDATFDSWLERVAGNTEGFSGAALAAVVRAAVARALDRSVTSERVQDCRVTSVDFNQAIEDLRASSLELQESPGEVRGGYGE
ncbi:hypothetical protein AB1Y20_010555 [Prymnesium parvum]|uniref:Vesicle-fusing ATPase n=1 Tax=Prymnesium parvum TaxID=97485 RepID=A0AB34IRU6_PRYPA